MPTPASVREAELQAENLALRRALAAYERTFEPGSNPAASDSPLWMAAPDLLGVTDLQGLWLEVNPAWTSLLGWPRERILGRSSDWLVHPDDLAARAMHQAHAGPDGRREYRCRAADGSYRLISWVRVQAGARWHHAGRDVTDERARETALRDSLDFARLALSAVSGVGVWTYDAASDRFFCDAGIAELYGIDPDQGAAGILRSGFLANVHPDDLASLRATMAGGLLRSGDLELEYRIRHPDGSIRWVLSRGHTYFDDAGNPVRRTGVGIDTTRQRLLEQQLRQSQKMEAVGQLTGGIAHDFNNMLQGVIGPLDMLRMRIGQLSDAAILQYVEMAMASSRRAATLTHRLLAFSRRQPLAPQRVDVKLLVQGLAELFRRTIGERIELSLAFESEDCLTRCDANQLENAVLNLVINARDAMPDGGVLTISTSVVAFGLEAAGQHGVQAGAYVCVAVRDNGVGMPPAVVQQACEPFFTTKPIGQGTGLGLSMVHGFAGQSGGFATIDSSVDASVGSGTTVGIYLPVSAGAVEVEVAHAPSSNAVRGGDGATLLLVDDDPSVRAILCELLQGAQYRVRTAASGFEAQAGIEADARIDLLITDIGLPGMNGRQLAEAARRVLPDLPVLFMTGYAELAAAASGFMAPGMALIAKPFDLDALLARVRTMLDTARG